MSDEQKPEELPLCPWHNVRHLCGAQGNTGVWNRGVKATPDDMNPWADQSPPKEGQS